MVNPDIFESDGVAKSCQVSYRTITEYGGTTCRPSFSRVNLDTIGYVWTGEFNLNTLRVDREISESGKKKLQIQKHPVTCGRGLSKPRRAWRQERHQTKGLMSRTIAMHKLFQCWYIYLHTCKFLDR